MLAIPARLKPYIGSRNFYRQALTVMIPVVIQQLINTLFNVVDNVMVGGIGALAIFGSYIGKDHSLAGEAVRVGVLDTFVAFTAGLIIFPACFAFDVAPDAGPNLIFITLPNVFNEMPMGRLWGSLFFVFMSFAALTTVIAVFENILSFSIEKWGWSRKKAVLVNLVAILILSMPCVLGFNVLSGIQPFGEGSAIMDLEDFIVSNNILPLGSLVYLLFCVSAAAGAGKASWRRPTQAAD